MLFKPPLAPTALALALAMPFALVAPAQAAVSTYTDRASFLAAAGATQVQSFADITTDRSFHTSALQVGDATFQGFGVNPTGYNLIEVAPFGVPVAIDGSTFLLGGVAVGGGFTVTYSHPVTAWGADFNDLQNQVARTTIELVGAGTVSPPVTPDNRSITFFGVTSSTPFTVLRFTGINASVADGFAMDNLTTPVPEPSTALLLALGAAAVLLGRLGAAPRRTGRPA